MVPDSSTSVIALPYILAFTDWLSSGFKNSRAAEAVNSSSVGIEDSARGGETELTCPAPDLGRRWYVMLFQKVLCGRSLIVE